MISTPEPIAAAGFKVLEALPSLPSQSVFLCSKEKGRQAFRIVVMANDEIVGAFPDSKSCELKVYNQKQLHRGKYLLFENFRSNAANCALPALNLETLEVEAKYFVPEIPEMTMVIGADVDDTGRYTLLETSWTIFRRLSFSTWNTMSSSSLMVMI